MRPTEGTVEQNPRPAPPLRPNDARRLHSRSPTRLKLPARERSEQAGNTICRPISPDEDVRVIIRNVADLFGLNVVIPQELTGRGSLKPT